MSELPAAPTRWVEDHAGLMSPTAREALDLRLEGYQDATGHQVVVWIGDTIHGADLAGWATRTFDAWDLGREGEDDGLAIFVLARDRDVAIEVGYGLEGSVPDATASRIIREVIVPRMQAGDADRALMQGTDAVLTAIEGQPWEGASAPPQQAVEPDYLGFGAGVVFLIVMAILAMRNPRMAFWVLMAGLTRGRVGGGHRGGFLGGGGRSGGGGARGSW